MEERRLGKTDMVVTRLSLGGLFTSRIGGELQQTRAAVHRALELGINYIDTAPSYANSEETLGKCLADVQTPYCLSTKLGGKPEPFDARDADGLRSSFEESLRLLGRDYVDILYIHEPDRPGQNDWWESWDTFHGPVCDVIAELKNQGLVRYTGLGGTTAYEMAYIIERTDYDVLLTAFQYSLLWREAEIAVIPAARAKGMGIVAGSPLQQGWLSRRFDDVVRDNPPPWLSPARREQFLRLYALCDGLEMTLPTLATRFVISNPDVDTTLTGARSAEEAELNVAAVEAGPLPDDVLAELDDIYDTQRSRPHAEPAGCALGGGYRGPGHIA